MLLPSTINALITRASSSKATPQLIVNTTVYSKQTEVNLSHRIAYGLEMSGFSIINARDAANAIRVMAILREMIGSPQIQNMRGTTEENVFPVTNATRYINTRAAQPLHTDNGYACVAPDFMALRCLKAALTGGETLLVDVESLLKYMLNRHSAKVELLYNPKSITYVTGSVKVSKSIFQRAPDGKTRINFSVFADAIIGDTKECEDLFLSIVEFIHSPSNQMQYLLNKHDIIVADNRAVLHGRKEFEGERWLLRTWYDADIIKTERGSMPYGRG